MRGDCDDTDASLNADDRDGDGYSNCNGDCDDTDRFTYTEPLNLVAQQMYDRC